MKISKKEAKQLLNKLWLPNSSNRAVVLAADTKDARQAILRDSEHEDKQLAAAIEIQRVYRGYSLRCKLYDILHGGISNEPQGPHSSYKWSELSVQSSQDSSQFSEIPAVVYTAPSTPLISEQPPEIPKSHSRLKLEDDYYKWKENNQLISFEDYCALVIQSWWYQVCEERRNIRVPSVRPPTMAESYSSFGGRTTRRTHDQLTRPKAAKIIQRAWRKHVDIQVYRYYRDLISFKFRGDPVLLLRCINPREAELLDSGSGTHVKFRLAGRTFPPNIYYKIFTHRPVVDMCANSPKDYTKAPTKQLMPRQCHNKEYVNIEQDNKEGWYQRYENNGWRLVSDRILRRIDEDAVTYDSAQTKMEFKHCRLMRKEDLEKKRKRRKIDWMKKMYREGMLLSKQGTESSVVKDIEDSLKGMVRATDNKGYDAVDEWEVDELLEWTNGLNFDTYVSTWKEYATSATSGQIAEKQKFFRDGQGTTTYTR